jgi:pilus assembly protein CpaE
MSSATQVSDDGGAKALSIAVIGPDDERRETIASALAGSDGGGASDLQRFGAGLAVREFSSYPSDLIDLPTRLAQRFDVVLVDLDSDQEYALEVVESISAAQSAMVMVYSEQADRGLVIQSMRAGAREFLSLPLAPGEVEGALARVSVRGPAVRGGRGTSKKLFVFLGAKGGCGVTTVATSFAASLAQDSGQSTLLIDLGAPLGDAAIRLGTSHEYSTINALDDFRRLDASLLRTLVGKHSSGLSVLSAPGDFPRTHAPVEAIDKLLAVARQSFQNVVVDAGVRFDLENSSLFEDSTNAYLITQVGVSELRNANRLITQFFCKHCPKLQIVLNRYIPQSLGFNDEQVAKALTRPAQWKVPNDDVTDRLALSTINSPALEETPTSKAIRQMARAACGLPPLKQKKKALSLFGWVRAQAPKRSKRPAAIRCTEQGLTEATQCT